MNNYFEKMREKLENDFINLQNSSKKYMLSKSNLKPTKNFTIFSSEKKLPKKDSTINSEGSNQKSGDSKFLTPMLLRHTSNHVHEKDNLRKTNWKTEKKTHPEIESPDFFNKYLSANGLRQGSLQDVFDVLRLENPDFRVIDNKIRTLLCLIKTLVVRAVMIENGNKNKNPEIGKFLCF